MTMLTDDDLERLLADAAALAPEPEGGPPDLVVTAATPLRARRIPRWLPAAAVVLVALLIGREVLDDPEPRAETAATPTTTADEQEPTVAPPAPATTVARQLEEQDFAGGGGGSVGSSSGSLPGTGTGAGGSASAAAPAQPVTDPTRIVHEGSIEVEVDEGGFGPTVERVGALATGLGGHVAASQTTEQGDAPRGTITVRVPAGSFEQLLGEIRRLGDVRSVATSGTDVTSQYTDLEARLTALGATRNQLLTVLAQARAIPDILAVQDRLNVVQVEIESLEGQRRLLEDRSSFGTLAVTVVEPGAEDPEPIVTATDDDGGLGAAWDEARRGFGDALEWLVARSGKALVLAAIALALYGVGVLAWRRLRRTAL